MNGSLVVVGTGPGKAELMTPATQAALTRATDLVGYGPYLDRIPARDDQCRHASDNRVELDRARLALSLAASGRQVAVTRQPSRRLTIGARPVADATRPRNSSPAYPRMMDTMPSCRLTGWKPSGNEATQSPAAASQLRRRSLMITRTRATRSSSRSTRAAVSSSKWWSVCEHITTSTDRSAKGSAVALPRTALPVRARLATASVSAMSMVMRDSSIR